MYFKGKERMEEAQQQQQSEVHHSICLLSCGKPTLLTVTLGLPSTMFTKVTFSVLDYFSSNLLQWKTLLVSIRRVMSLTVKNLLLLVSNAWSQNTQKIQLSATFLKQCFGFTKSIDHRLLSWAKAWKKWRTLRINNLLSSIRPTNSSSLAKNQQTNFKCNQDN